MSSSEQLEAKVQTTLEVLNRLVAEHGDGVTFANSLGAEDMVLTHLICRHVPQIEIFSLDTGRLPEETVRLLHRVQRHYGRVVKVFYPDAARLEQYVLRHGINAFYDSVELRKRCCEIRKVEPLRRALSGKKAWVTGLRRSQSVTRTALAEVAWDEDNGLYKASPLADWSEAEVWAFIRQHEVPYNELHDRNYPSIGCAPCTRAITIGEDPRAGRWWWEQPESKECGLHTRRVA